MAESEYGAYPRKGASRSGSSTGYSVEARVSSGAPHTVSGQPLDGLWRRMCFADVSPGFGVPKTRYPRLDPHMRTLDLLSWEAANALRWCLHALPEAPAVLETRVVQHVVEYQQAEFIIGAVEGGGDVPQAPRLDHDALAKAKAHA